MKIYKAWYFVFILSIFFFCTKDVHSAVKHNLATTTEWSIRIDGAEAGHGLPSQWYTKGIASGDFDNDGKQDLVVGAGYTDYNSQSNSGSVYIIFGSLLQSLQSTGHTLDLSNSANYSIRIDGATASDYLSYGITESGDINGNNIDDLVIGAYDADSDKGHTYILYDNIISSYTGTGNSISLSSNNSYNIRYVGAGSGDYSGFGGGLADMDGDGKLDLIIGSPYSDNNSRANSGSAYIIYNTLIDDYSGTGNSVSLGTSTNYNLRFDGASAGVVLSSDSLFIPYTQDLDGDGKNDLGLSAPYSGFNSRANSGSVYFIFGSLIDDYSGTGNNIDLANSSKYSLRFDGAGVGDRLSYSSNPVSGDLDNDSKQDLFLPNSNDGVAYLFFGTLIDNYSGTGNNINLSDSSKYSIYIEGAEHYLAYYAPSYIQDFNNDGKDDLIVAESYTNYAGVGDGSVYVLLNQIFSGYTGTGNTFSLSSENNYNLRFDNPTTTGTFANAAFLIPDIDNDGSFDFLIGDGYQDYNSRADSGSLWIIYNFPHTITQTSATRDGANATIVGRVTASNSTTVISGVQYKINNNSASSGWSHCSANDANFNSRSETFTCNITNAPTTDGTHNIYVRAFDANSTYTARSRYLTHRYTIGESIESTPQISSDTVELSGGVFSAVVDSNTKGQTITTILEPHTFSFDAFVYARALAANANGSLPNPMTGVESSVKPKNVVVLGGGTLGIKSKNIISWQVGNIQNIWYKAYAPGYQVNNAAKIIPSLQAKPSIIALTYTNADLIIPGQIESETKKNKSFSTKNLKLAHSLDGITWTILPTSVVDFTNKTVAALHKIGGYYMIVGK